MFDRSYSRHWRDISWLAVTATPGSNSRNRAAAAASWVGLMYACRKTTATASTPAAAIALATASIESRKSGVLTLPFGVNPLGSLKAQMPRHKRFRRLGVQIVKVRAVAAADGDHVAKSLGGYDRRPHAFPFGDGVDHGGAAVNEERHLGR